MRGRLVILDFDGVLIESVGIKDAAFRALFQDYPEQLEAIMAYHLAHNATVRFVKFRHITEQILGLPYTKADEARLSAAFSDFVFQRILDCPVVAGAPEFLANCREQGVPLYLISKTPDDELPRILDGHGMAHYFRGVYAASWEKPTAMEDILAKEGVRPDQAVYIGDTPEDYQAARVVGIPFVGRQSSKSFGNAPIPVFADMWAVWTYLNAMGDSV